MNGTGQQTVIERVSTAVTDVGAQARTTATDATAIVATRAPAALAASRGILARALAGLQASTDGSLALGTAFAAGVSGGMLVSRAPRLLVALAFVPTLLLGGILVGRATTRAQEPFGRARA